MNSNKPPHAAIEPWLTQSGVKNYTIRSDGTVNVEGDVKLLSITTSIPVKFGNIGGDFSCFNTPITSLHGIHKTHQHVSVGGVVSIRADITHILGLSMIPGIKKIYIRRSMHRGGATFDVSHHDPIRFQDELLDAGFVEQARL